MGSEIAALWTSAELHLARRDHEAAFALYRVIVGREPQHVPAWLRLSSLATERGRPREAVSAALAAAAVDAVELPLRLHVGRRLLEVGESQAAFEACRRARLDAATPTDLRIDFAWLLHDLGEPALALALADTVHAAGVRDPAFRYLRATLQTFCGRIDEAERELEACVREAPHLAGAQWTLSKLRTWSPQHNHVERLQRSVVDAGDGPAAPYLHFALFKELEDCGRYPEAWAALVRGCAAKRRSVRHDRAAERDLFDQLMARCSAEFLSRQQAAAMAGPSPIFIVGLPRTGTTVLERILGAHPCVANAGELHDFPMQLMWSCDHQGRQTLDAQVVARADGIDFDELGRRYLSHTQWRARGRPFYTDKLPGNFMQVGFIHRALPGAKILHLVRDPMDACFSNLKELFGAANPYSYDIADLAAHFANYRRLMAHWHAALPGRVLDVSYEALVAEPERVAREVLAFCGLSWAPEVVAIERRTTATATASTVQVREPIHGRNVGQWKRYEHQLEPLRKLLLA